MDHIIPAGRPTRRKLQINTLHVINAHDPRQQPPENLQIKSPQKLHVYLAQPDHSQPYHWADTQNRMARSVFCAVRCRETGIPIWAYYSR